MGSCLCKKSTGTDGHVGAPNETVSAARGLVTSTDDFESYLPARSGSMRWKFPASTTVDKLVLETLSVVSSLVEK